MQKWIKDLYFKPQPKVKIFRSEDYLDFIRDKPCLMCGAPPRSDAHHEPFGKAGWAIKAPDSQAIPLCRGCHNRRGGKEGLAFLEKKYDIKMKIIEYLTEYINECLQM